MQTSNAAIDELIAQLRAIPGGAPPPPPTFPPSEGGGSSDGMEPRVAKLEAHMEHVRAELSKLSGLPVEIATIRTKVEHLPGKGFVVTAATTTVVAVTGLLVLLQKLGVLH